jgi:hypothetical protein
VRVSGPYAGRGIGPVMTPWYSKLLQVVGVKFEHLGGMTVKYRVHRK